MIDKKPVNPFLSGIRDKSLSLFPPVKMVYPLRGRPAGFGIKSKRFTIRWLGEKFT
jgi:hypothetical protein